MKSQHKLVCCPRSRASLYLLRKKMEEMVHSSHLGIQGCLRRARDMFYWLRMNAEFKDFIVKRTAIQVQASTAWRDANAQSWKSHQRIGQRLVQICSCLTSVTTWLLLTIILLSSRRICLRKITWQIPELSLRSWKCSLAAMEFWKLSFWLTMQPNMLVQSSQSLQVAGTFNTSFDLHGISKLVEKSRVS